MYNLRRFLERLTRFNLKLAPNQALLGAAEIIFLGRRISSEGVGPDPGKVKAMKAMPMPQDGGQDVSQLRSMLGAMLYYRRQLSKIAARTRPHKSLLREGVKFEFSPHHERIVQETLDKLSSSSVLAFPDFEAAISGSRKFRLVTDASADELGVVIGQQQPDGSIRPFRYLSRSTLDNQRKWSISELECAAIVWAITRDRQMFHGIPFEVETYHQPLQNLASLSDKSNILQIWFGFLSAYTFTLMYRSKNANANADVLSRLPLPATAEDLQPRYHLTAPSDLDVTSYGRCQRNSPLKTSNIIGLKFGWTGQRLGWTGKRFGWTGDNSHQCFFREGGKGVARAQKYGQQVWRVASKIFLVEDEAQYEQWKAIQAVHPRLTWTFKDEERSTEFLLDEDSPLLQPTIHAVIEGQLEPRLLLSACRLTQERIDLLQQTQGAISAVTRSVTRERARPLRNSTRTARDIMRGPAKGTISPANSPGTEEKDEITSNSRATETCDENDEVLDRAAAIAFGNLLCEKKSIDWCEAQSRGPTARLVIKLLRAETKREDIPTDELKNKDIDRDEVWRVLGQCESTALPEHDNRKLLVRRPTREPASLPNRKPGRYECLLGDEPVRVYVPLMFRPWLIDRKRKEAVNLCEKVTLAMLERYYYWVDMASSVKWWIRRCYPCQARKKTRHTVRWPLLIVSLLLPFGRGQMAAFDLLGLLPRMKQGNEHVLLAVDLFSRHAEGYALSADEKTTQGCAVKLVHDYIPRWDCPHTFLSDRGPEFVSTVCREIFRMLGAVNIFTSSAHAQTTGMVERLNHALCQMLSNLVTDGQTN